MAQELPNSPDSRTSPYGRILIEKEDGFMLSTSLTSIPTPLTEDGITNNSADQPQLIPYNECNTFDSTKSRTFMEKLGFMSVAALSGGFIVILAAVAVLCFIWYDASRAIRHESPSSIWLSIVTWGWTTRVITICTAMLRAAVSLQTAVITPIVASLLLEVKGTRTHTMPLVSIVRAVSVSPTSLLRPTLSEFGPYSIVIIISSLLSTATQLISTILISDFATTSIASPATTRTLRIGGILPSQRYDLYTAAPANYWRFAEYTETLPQQPGTVDTGISFRAAIPFTDQSSRIRLLHYSGLHPVWNSRVACTTPTLLNASWDPDSESINGDLVLNDPNASSIAHAINGSAFSFRCVLPSTFPSICQLNTGPYLNHASWWSDLYLLVEPTETPFPSDWAFNASLTDSAARRSQREANSRRPFPQDSSSWITVRHSAGFPLAYLTVCATAINDPCNYRNVTMSGGPLANEPTRNYGRNEDDHDRMHPSSRQFSTFANQTYTSNSLLDTVGVRHQFDALEEYVPFEDREVIGLSILPGKPDTFNPSGTSRAPPWGANNTLVLGDGRGKSDVSDTGPVYAHPIHGAIFRDTLDATANPALAVQTLLTTLHLMQYYDSSYKVDLSASVSYVLSEAVLIPVRWSGLIAVLCMLVVHLAVVAVMLVLFLSRTQASMLGNAWQAVAQTISEETLPVLARADQMTDKELRKCLGSSMDITREGVVRNRKNGRVEFRSRYI
ncbi:hypothetical protein PG984_008387 [Apiospora sp. TS-2023a]